ncbi:MAG: hypothetical protein IJA23_02765 [Clostridia bacterium]|nr:hypothetical protein [Clostridia bacterium]
MSFMMSTQEYNAIKELIKAFGIETNVLPHDTSVANMQARNDGITPIFDYTRYSHSLPTEEEKSTTTGLYGFRLEEGLDVFWPHYVKNYNLSSRIETLGRIMVNSSLEAYPTPLETYGVSLDGANPILGSSVIDLNHMQTEDGRHIETMRLDRILKAAKINTDNDKESFPDLYSFADIQEFFANEYINSVMTPRAMIQVALCSYFIPNAIGDTDANSRNIILAKNAEGKYDVVFRIDAESSTYLRGINRERSGLRLMPKGIYSANENYDLYMNYIENKGPIKMTDKVTSAKIDWEMFAGLFYLSKYFIKRNHLDDAITNRGYSRNLKRYLDRNTERPSFYGRYLSQEEYTDYATDTIERAAKYMQDTGRALGITRKKIMFEDQAYKQTKTGIYVPEYLNAAGRKVKRDGSPAPEGPSM